MQLLQRLHAGQRVRHRGLRQVRRPGGELLGVVQGNGEAADAGCVGVGAGDDEACGADGGDRLGLSGIGAARHGQFRQEGVPGVDAGDLLGIGHDEARAERVLGDPHEGRQPQPAAPDRAGAAVEQVGGAVGEGRRVDRVEIAVYVEPEAVHHIARLHRAAGPARLPDDPLAAQVLDRAARVVAQHGEHAGREIHRADDLEPARRALLVLVEDLAAHQAEVEAAGVQAGGVVGRAAGRDGPQFQAAIDRAQGLDQRHRVGREAAALRRRAERQAHRRLRDRCRRRSHTRTHETRDQRAPTDHDFSQTPPGG